MFRSLFYLSLFFSLSLSSCQQQAENRSDLPALSTTMDGLVTRFYENFDKHTLDTISDTFILSYLSDQEKEVMSTQYWKLEVNVPITISLMRDTDQTTVPFWLNEKGFILTEKKVKNSHSTYEVWQKDFDKGLVSLGINGFDKHRPVYFIAITPQNANDNLEITPIFPGKQHFETMDVGAFTYHDWDELTLTEVPEELKGHQLLTTIRGRAREAHLVGAFRSTDFPSSALPDQVMLTWSQDPSTTIDIQWRTNNDVKEGKVRYWRADSQDTSFASSVPKQMEDRLLQNDRYIVRHTAKLTGLQPGSEYRYQVAGGPDEWTEIFSFKTSPDVPAPFSFIWFGDVHNTKEWGDMIQDTERKHPENHFYMIAGDLVNTGLHRDDWDKLFGYAGKTIARKPMLAIPGNHDSQDGLGAWMYEDMFSFPDNGPDGLPSGRTFHFTYQNALYLMMDATLPLAEQTPWMEKVLKENQADWKFVVAHFPPYNAVEPYEDIIQEWVPLFDKYEVDMVLGGHFHYYMRSKPLINSEVSTTPGKGTRYIISIGTTGKNKEAPKGYYAEKQFAAQFLYQHVELDGKSLKYTSYDAAGNIKDQFSLKK